jgi:hypothetical protein
MQNLTTDGTLSVSVLLVLSKHGFAY